MISSFSGTGQTATCIDVRRDEATGHIAITATLLPGQPTVLATQEELDKFIAGVKNGDFDELVAVHYGEPVTA